MPDIFDEVQEDLRAERASRLARRYGGFGAALLVAILAGTGGAVWWQQRQKEASEAVAARFIAAQKTADASAGPLGRNDHAQEDEASRALAGIVADSPAGYRTLARLRLADLQWQMGKHGDAVGSWQSVADDTQAPRLLRDLATLTSGQRQLETGDPVLLKQQLMSLTGPGNAWRPLAEQTIALLDLRTGKPRDAAALLKRLSADTGVPEGLREMASDMLQTIDLPPEPAVTSAPPASAATPAPAVTSPPATPKAPGATPHG